MFLDLTKRLFFVSAAGQARVAPEVCHAAKQLSCYKSLQTQAARISQNRLRVSNMLKKHHHHHHHRHRHQNHIINIINLAYNLQFSIEK